MAYRDEEDDDDRNATMTGPVEHFLIRYKAYAECDENAIDGIETELEGLLKEMNDEDRTTALTLSRRIPINREDDD